MNTAIKSQKNITQPRGSVVYASQAAGPLVFRLSGDRQRRIIPDFLKTMRFRQILENNRCEMTYSSVSARIGQNRAHLPQRMHLP